MNCMAKFEYYLVMEVWMDSCDSDYPIASFGGGFEQVLAKLLSVPLPTPRLEAIHGIRKFVSAHVLQCKELYMSSCLDDVPYRAFEFASLMHFHAGHIMSTLIFMSFYSNVHKIWYYSMSF